MIENETLIEKISKHPRIWGFIVFAAAVCCIVLGTLGLMPIKKVSEENASAWTESFTKAEVSLVRCDEESFGIRNTFCRYIPTGVQYFYLAYTEDGQHIFVRADKDWADSFSESDVVKIYGAANSFNKREKVYIEDAYALNADGYVDLMYVRLNVLLIAAGVILLAVIGLGALMIKEKIPPKSMGYKFANIVFCVLPVLAAALGIYLVGFV